MTIFQNKCSIEVSKIDHFSSVNIKDNMYHGVYIHKSYDDNILTSHSYNIFNKGKYIRTFYYGDSCIEIMTPDVY